MSERKRKCNARRDSGGVLIYYRQDIGKGVQKVEKKMKDAIWLKLDKNYFGLNNDLYLCTVYIPPRNSPTYVVSDDGKDMHDTIAREIGIFSTLGDVAMIGDMNSRVGSIQEKHYGVDTDSRSDDLSRVKIVAPRNTHDIRVNTHGRKLVQLMTNYDMMLANGRICGDMAGNYTCCQRNGCSVVDMLIVQRDLLPIIDYFKVLAFDWYSDHAVTSASFSVDITKTLETPKEWVRCFSALQNWDDETKQLFLSRLNERDITAK